LANVKRYVNDFRAAVEAACQAQFDGISITQAAIINTACWNERLLRVWAKRLADCYETASDDAIARATDKIARHAAQRDASLARLRLDDDAVDALAAIYATPHAFPLCEAPAVEPPVSVDRGQAPAGADDTEAGS
jgi:hypothetical protein